MAVHDLDLLSDNNIAEYREERENSRHCRLAIDDEKGDVVHLESIGKVSDATTAFVGVRYDDYLVASVNELCGKLVDMAFDASRLRKEEVADHGNIVRHCDDCCPKVAPT